MTIYLYPIGILASCLFIYMALSKGAFFPYGSYALVFGLQRSVCPWSSSVKSVLAGRPSSSDISYLRPGLIMKT